MKKCSRVIFFIVLSQVNILIFSQKLITGTIVEKVTSEPIAMVAIYTSDKSKSVLTDEKGHFQLSVPIATKKLISEYLGYYRQEINLNPMLKVEENFQIVLILKNELLAEVILHGVIDIVKDEQKPMAVSTIISNDIEKLIGTKELPELLNLTPSVYATKNGGGYGDVGVSVRGFDQRNTAVLINGMPVNDMESGNVYWSNWLGLGKITKTIQIQRGLGLSKLAIPSVGGTINILTKPANKKQGGTISTNFRNNNYQDYVVNYNTGLLENGLAISVLLGRFIGDGFADATEGAGYNLYLDTSYKWNNRHKFQLTLISAPQWHEQRNNLIPIKDYIKYGGSNTKPNIFYNSEWGYLNGKSYTWSKNYYHKPLASLNWEWKINQYAKLSSVIYAAWGNGGGTAPIGKINGLDAFQNELRNSKGLYRLDDIVAWNSGQEVNDFGTIRTPNADGSFTNTISEGLTRNAFMNSQAWYGTIINYNKQFSEQFSLDLGLDLRTHTGYNSLTVNNVLGADNYFDFFDINNPNRIIDPSEFVMADYKWNIFSNTVDDQEKIVFYKQSKVRWFGAFGQFSYKNKNISSFVQASLSRQMFQRVDYFNLPRDVNGDGSQESQQSEWVNKYGGNVKMGVDYKFSPKSNMYFNAGFFSKQALFEAVFANFSDNTVSENLENEKIISFETGFSKLNKHWRFNLNLYYTSWSDRYALVSDQINGIPVFGRMYGIKELHTGLELETQFQHGKWNIKGMLSLGDWKYQGDVKDVDIYDATQQFITTQDYYLDGVKVGNTGQFTAKYAVTYNVLKKLSLNMNHFFVSNLYASFGANNFKIQKNEGVLKLPSYDLIDVGVFYEFDITPKKSISLQFSIDNIFDTIYISESETNYTVQPNGNTWNGVNTDNRVFFGWGRSWSLATKFLF